MINLYPGETEHPRCDWLCISGNTPSFDHNNIVFECLLMYFVTTFKTLANKQFTKYFPYFFLLFLV